MIKNDAEIVLSKLGTGRESAKSRSSLSSECLMSDRRIRECIERLRNDGNIILNLQDGSGYYISDELSEISKQYWQDTARALSIMKRRKKMRKILKDAGWRV